MQPKILDQCTNANYKHVSAVLEFDKITIKVTLMDGTMVSLACACVADKWLLPRDATGVCLIYNIIWK